MKARAALAAYLAAILLGTTVHDPRCLGLGLVLALVLAGSEWRRVLFRAVRAVVAFNAIITASYALVAGLKGNFSLDYVLLVNLRVLFLTCLTFVFVARVNAFEALAFSGGLTYLFVLAYSQAMTFRQVLVNFRLAFRSRCIERPVLSDRYRHSAGLGAHLLEKALNNATEITYVMRSRGFFDA